MGIIMHKVMDSALGSMASFLVNWHSPRCLHYILGMGSGCWVVLGLPAVLVSTITWWWEAGPSESLSRNLNWNQERVASLSCELGGGGEAMFAKWPMRWGSQSEERWYNAWVERGRTRQQGGLVVLPSPQAFLGSAFPLANVIYLNSIGRGLGDGSPQFQNCPSIFCFHP